jgi:hypothetical protein
MADLFVMADMNSAQVRERETITTLACGFSDWFERAPGATAERYESRAILIGASAQDGFYDYHLGERHDTRLRMAPPPS